MNVVDVGLSLIYLLNTRSEYNNNKKCLWNVTIWISDIQINFIIKNQLNWDWTKLLYQFFLNKIYSIFSIVALSLTTGTIFCYDPFAAIIPTYSRANKIESQRHKIDMDRVPNGSRNGVLLFHFHSFLFRSIECHQSLLPAINNSLLAFYRNGKHMLGNLTEIKNCANPLKVNIHHTSYVWYAIWVVASRKELRYFSKLETPLIICFGRKRACNG